MDVERIQYEGTVDMKYLVFSVLRAWRVVLVVALVFGLLLGGLELITAVANRGPVPFLSEEEMKTAEKTVADNERTIIHYEAVLAQRRTEAANWKKQLKVYNKTREMLDTMEIPPSRALVNLMNLLDKIESLSEAISENERFIPDLENRIRTLNADNKILRADMAKTVPSASGLLSAVKKLVVGGVLGAVLACLFLCLRNGLNGRLQSQYVLEAKYGVHILANLHPAVYAEKTGRHKGLDRLLDRMEGIHERIDISEEYGAAAAKLHLLRGSCSTVLVTGTVEQEILEAAAANLRENLPDQSLKLVVAPNLCRNREGILLLPESKVLLVEAVGVSKTASCTKLCTFLMQTKADVLGAVMV